MNSIQNAQNQEKTPDTCINKNNSCSLLQVEVNVNVENDDIDDDTKINCRNNNNRICIKNNEFKNVSSLEFTENYKNVETADISSRTQLESKAYLDGIIKNTNNNNFGRTDMNIDEEENTNDNTNICSGNEEVDVECASSDERKNFEQGEGVVMSQIVPEGKEESQLQNSSQFKPNNACDDLSISQIDQNPDFFKILMNAFQNQSNQNKETPLYHCSLPKIEPQLSLDNNSTSMVRSASRLIDSCGSSPTVDNLEQKSETRMNQSSLVSKNTAVVEHPEQPSISDSNTNQTSNPANPTETKLHECPICAKEFRASSLLDIHMRTHVSAKPFRCDRCPHRASQKGNLKMHMKKHHAVELPHHLDALPDAGIWCLKGESSSNSPLLLNENDPSGQRRGVIPESENLQREVIRVIRKIQNKFGQASLTRPSESQQDFLMLAGEALEREGMSLKEVMRSPTPPLVTIDPSSERDRGEVRHRFSHSSGTAMRLGSVGSNSSLKTATDQLVSQFLNFQPGQGRDNDEKKQTLGATITSQTNAPFNIFQHNNLLQMTKYFQNSIGNGQNNNNNLQKVLTQLSNGPRMEKLMQPNTVPHTGPQSSSAPISLFNQNSLVNNYSNLVKQLQTQQTNNIQQAKQQLLINNSVKYYTDQAISHQKSKESVAPISNQVNPNQSLATPPICSMANNNLKKTNSHLSQIVKTDGSQAASASLQNMSNQSKLSEQSSNNSLPDILARTSNNQYSNFLKYASLMSQSKSQNNPAQAQNNSPTDALNNSPSLRPVDASSPVSPNFRIPKVPKTTQIEGQVDNLDMQSQLVKLAMQQQAKLQNNYIKEREQKIEVKQEVQEASKGLKSVKLDPWENLVKALDIFIKDQNIQIKKLEVLPNSGLYVKILPGGVTKLQMLKQMSLMLGYEMPGFESLDEVGELLIGAEEVGRKRSQGQDVLPLEKKARMNDGGGSF